MKEDAHLAHSPAAKSWQRIGIKHHHGIAIALSSLHSTHSYGIGEFTDLIPLIDWCASVGFDVIQLLPINDTGLGISPYSAISAFALQPLFLGLNLLPYVQESSFLQKELAALPKLSPISLVEYDQIRKYKEKFLYSYFHQVGLKLIKSEDFTSFVHQARFWLKGYAVFNILKKRYHGMSWEAWPELENQLTSKWIDRVADENQEEFNWFCLLQFLCDQQLRSVKAYALQKNVFLMGDIPILINRDSADVGFIANYSILTILRVLP